MSREEADSAATTERDAEPVIVGYAEFTFIGGGATSTVWKAYEDELDRWVAVKVLRPGFSQGSHRERFDREKRITGRLGKHPNIVKVFATGTTQDGRAYMAMDLCELGSVADHLSREGTFTVEETLDIGIKLADALQAAHEAEILHRDVKPDNVLLSHYGPALTDFGISRSVANTEWTESLLWLSIAHAPPEAFVDDNEQNATADVYSLGSTLYTMLAGQPAFSLKPGERHVQFLLRLERDPIPPIRRPDIPEGLVDVIACAMAKDPEDRFATAAAFANALRAVQRELVSGAVDRAAPAIDLREADAPAAAPPEAVAQNAQGATRERQRDSTGTLPEQQPVVDEDATTVKPQRTTVVRPRRPLESDSDQVSQPAAQRDRGMRRAVLIGVGVFVLLAVVAAAILVVGSGSDSDPEAETATTTDTLPIVTEGAPENLEIVDGGTIADLTWDDTSGGTASFVINVIPEGGEPSTATAEPGTTAYSATGLDEDLPYCFLVRAVLGDADAVAQTSECIRGGSFQTDTGT